MFLQRAGEAISSVPLRKQFKLMSLSGRGRGKERTPFMAGALLRPCPQKNVYAAHHLPSENTARSNDY